MLSQTALVLQIGAGLIAAVSAPFFISWIMKGRSIECIRDRSTRESELLGTAAGGNTRRPDVLMGCAASVDPVVPYDSRAELLDMLKQCIATGNLPVPVDHEARMVVIRAESRHKNKEAA